MVQTSPLWGAVLHHLRLDSGRRDAMVAFYRQGLGMTDEAFGDDATVMRGGARRFLIGDGATGAIPFVAFAFPTLPQLEDYRAYVQGKGFNVQPSPTPLFGPEAFALDDPDGRAVVFGLDAEPDGDDDPLPGRLQHAVVATTSLKPMTDFYIDGLGFTVSDWVNEGDEPTACFLRSDPEHHSFAAFRAPERRFDHMSVEAPSWNDIRDWADHFATHEVPIWWGPGRHGPGDNLFIMVEDPDGNKFEVSSEIEHMHRHMPHRTWNHEERTLNLWGSAWMRS